MKWFARGFERRKSQGLFILNISRRDRCQLGVGLFKLKDLSLSFFILHFGPKEVRLSLIAT
jgi:hypothetical protein